MAIVKFYLRSRPLQAAQVPPQRGSIADSVRCPKVIRQTESDPSEDVDMTPPRSVVAHVDVVAGAAVVPRPLQDRQVSVPRCALTGLAVPGAPVLAGPAEEPEVARLGCLCASGRVPLAAVGEGKF